MLSKLDELAIPEKTLIERLESFYYEERIRLRRKFEEMKEVTERFLKQINEKFYAAKNKNVNNRMHVSKFYDIENISSSHYEDKMSTLAEIIKINAKRLHSLNPRYIALDPKLVLLKKIDEVFTSMGK